MLVLSRSLKECIRIADNVYVQVVEIRRDKVRIGIVAPREIRVQRTEHLDGHDEFGPTNGQYNRFEGMENEKHRTGETSALDPGQERE